MRISAFFKSAATIDSRRASGWSCATTSLIGSRNNGVQMRQDVGPQCRGHAETIRAAGAVADFIGLVEETVEFLKGAAGIAE